MNSKLKILRKAFWQLALKNHFLSCALINQLRIIQIHDSKPCTVEHLVEWLVFLPQELAEWVIHTWKEKPSHIPEHFHELGSMTGLNFPDSSIFYRNFFASRIADEAGTTTHKATRGLNFKMIFAASCIKTLYYLPSTPKISEEKIILIESLWIENILKKDMSKFHTSHAFICTQIAAPSTLNNSKRL